MQIDSQYKLEKACDTSDESKHSLGYIHVNDNNTAMATNGRIVAVVECVVGSGDCVGVITPDSLIHARKHTMAEGATVLFLKTASSVVAEDSTEFPRNYESKAIQKEEQLEFLSVPKPDGKKVEDAVIKTIPTRSESDIVLTFNPTLLKKLAEALGSSGGVSLRFMPDSDNRVTSCIRVDTDNEEVYGAIMPMRAKE